MKRQEILPGADHASIGPVDVPAGWDCSRDRAVLLLDEIDKADPDLPNSLLEVLGANGFTVALTGEVVSCPPERRPLIVLTTNDDRELPAAVLRRCLVLTLTLPLARRELVKELVAIGTEHQEWLVSDAVGQRHGRCLVLREAADAIAKARESTHEGAYKPGTSEFLDLAAALAELWPDDRRVQLTKLRQLQNFVTNKSDVPAA